MGWGSASRLSLCVGELLLFVTRFALHGLRPSSPRRPLLWPGWWVVWALLTAFGGVGPVFWWRVGVVAR